MVTSRLARGNMARAVYKSTTLMACWLVELLLQLLLLAVPFCQCLTYGQTNTASQYKEAVCQTAILVCVYACLQMAKTGTCTSTTTIKAVMAKLCKKDCYRPTVYPFSTAVSHSGKFYRLPATPSSERIWFTDVSGTASKTFLEGYLKTCYFKSIPSAAEVGVSHAIVEAKFTWTLGIIRSGNCLRHVHP